MGGCNCGKNGAPTGWGSTPTAEQLQQQQAEEQARQVPQNAAQEQALASGSSMGFALRDRTGRTQTFGSTLERNAFLARNGGSIIR